MRAAELVPRLAPLGSRVYYTHRASGVVAYTDIRDVTRSEKRMLWRQFEHMRPPTRERKERSGEPRQLDRWVMCWPAVGYGTVIGLTYRSEGYRESFPIGGYDSPPEGDQPYLVEVARYPVYQVRDKLNGPVRLVPVTAAVPLDAAADYGLAGGEYKGHPPGLHTTRDLVCKPAGVHALPWDTAGLREAEAIDVLVWAWLRPGRQREGAAT